MTDKLTSLLSPESIADIIKKMQLDTEVDTSGTSSKVNVKKNMWETGELSEDDIQRDLADYGLKWGRFAGLTDEQLAELHKTGKDADVGRAVVAYMVPSDQFSGLLSGDPSAREQYSIDKLIALSPNMDLWNAATIIKLKNDTDKEAIRKMAEKYLGVKTAAPDVSQEALASPSMKPKSVEEKDTETIDLTATTKAAEPSEEQKLLDRARQKLEDGDLDGAMSDAEKLHESGNPMIRNQAMDIYSTASSRKMKL